MFPAGAVSTAPDKLGRKPATDWPWQPFTAQLIQRSKATVVPIFFSGQNSRLFQIASHISATLRLSLIFKEVHDRIGTELPLVIGEQISASEISEISDRAALTVMLRDRTYALAGRLPSNVSTIVPFKRSPRAEIAAKFRELVRKIRCGVTSSIAPQIRKNSSFGQGHEIYSDPIRAYFVWTRESCALTVA